MSSDVVTHNLLEHTSVQLPLRSSALVQLVIVLLQAAPVLSKFFQTIRVNVFETVQI